MTRLGLVHTVPALAATFHDLVTEAAPADVEPIHVVDPWLLRTALAGGVGPEVVERLAAHVAHLRGRGVAGVLVTCSTLGEATEQVPEPDLPVLRVDQGMADRAVELAGDGGRVAVLATVDSTLGPTERLLHRSAHQAGRTVTVEAELVDGPGTTEAAIRRWDGRVDVVVLAQASMAAAATQVGVTATPVLTSPELAARRLVALTTPA
ncbi:hypothetical protein [Jiangella alba]|uniref:Asp/Glu/Hydantoin racemase n=1 Tax=Jiangella alba TaxID=561176 RepID=A0A1H5PL34_9ACTN|nr:hypothetical protein [Jiangella alba]SEF14602.1 hypothetical protein SAMN04488561_4677 [Jiangella alba]